MREEILDGLMKKRIIVFVKQLSRKMVYVQNEKTVTQKTWYEPNLASANRVVLVLKNEWKEDEKFS